MSTIKRNTGFYARAVVVIACGLTIPAMAAAEAAAITDAQAQSQSQGVVGSDPGADASELSASSRSERARQAVAQRGDAVARWIDDFFDDPSVEAEAASTRLDLRQSIELSHRDDHETKTRVSAKLNLPRLSKRVSLTFQGNTDEPELEDGGAASFADKTEDSLDEPSLGLEYIARDKGRLHTSFSAGTRINNPSVNFGPRVRYQHQLTKHWSGRYTQRFLYDSKDRFESRTRIDFDRPLQSGNLIRQSFRADWRDNRADTEGMAYTLRSAYVQRLDDDTGISYELVSRYTTQPQASWHSHVLRARYRRHLRYDWLFLEISPFIGFEQEHDWQFNPGIKFSLDIIFETDPES